MEEEITQEKTIDLTRVLRAIVRAAWIWLLSGAVAAAVVFCVAKFLVPPQYASSVLLYVNGGSAVGKKLDVICQSNATLERVAEKLDTSYDCEQLSSYVSVSAEEDTGFMRVTVTLGDPFEAAKIANCIAEVLPIRVAEIIEGVSMEVVDKAIANETPIAPDVLRSTLIGGLLGMLLACVGVGLACVLDDRIEGEGFLARVQGCPLLAKIPPLTEKGGDYDYYRAIKR